MVASFQAAWMRETSRQLAGIRRAQDLHHAAQERHILVTGQVLEAVSRRKPRKATSGHIWNRLKEWSERFELVHKVYRALVWSRVVSWPIYAYGGLRWLGWL